jgi:hypothetical protein
MQVSVYEDGAQRGTLQTQERGLYTVFEARVRCQGVCKLYAVYDQGRMALGVPVPDREGLFLRCSLPTGRLPGGMLLRGELLGVQSEWTPYAGGRLGRVTLPPGRRRENVYRFSWQPGEALPCDSLLCFYRYQDGALELTLDSQGRPQIK